MAILKSQISVPMVLGPGSCQTARAEAALSPSRRARALHLCRKGSKSLVNLSFTVAFQYDSRKNRHGTTFPCSNVVGSHERCHARFIGSDPFQELQESTLAPYNRDGQSRHWCAVPKFGP